MKAEQVKIATPELREQLLQRLQEIIPSVFSEGILDLFLGYFSARNRSGNRSGFALKPRLVFVPEEMWMASGIVCKSES